MDCHQVDSHKALQTRIIGPRRCGGVLETIMAMNIAATYIGLDLITSEMAVQSCFWPPSAVRKLHAASAYHCWHTSVDVLHVS